MQKKNILMATLGGVLFGFSLMTTTTVKADSFDEAISQEQTTITQANTALTQLATEQAANTTQVLTYNQQLKSLGLDLTQEEKQLNNLQTAVVAPVTTNATLPQQPLVASTFSLTATNSATTEKDDEAELAAEEAKVAQLRQQIADLQKEVSNLNAATAQKEQSKASYQATIATANAKIADLKAQQAAYNSEQGLRNRLVSGAYAQLGKPYVWGAQGPSSFDCSGLMNYLYTNVASLSIGSWTVPQETSGTKIAVSAAEPGDLIFWGSAGSTYHVAMYIGDGQYIHAPHTGDVVKVSSLSSSNAPSFAVSVLG